MAKYALYPPWFRDASISSFEKKPARGGSPARAIVPKINVV